MCAYTHLPQNGPPKDLVRVENMHFSALLSLNDKPFLTLVLTHLICSVT